MKAKRVAAAAPAMKAMKAKRVASPYEEVQLESSHHQHCEQESANVSALPRHTFGHIRRCVDDARPQPFSARDSAGGAPDTDLYLNNSTGIGDTIANTRARKLWCFARGEASKYAAAAWAGRMWPGWWFGAKYAPRPQAVLYPSSFWFDFAGATIAHTATVAAITGTLSDDAGGRRAHARWQRAVHCGSSSDGGGGPDCAHTVPWAVREEYMRSPLGQECCRWACVASCKGARRGGRVATSPDGGQCLTGGTVAAVLFPQERCRQD